MARDFYPPTEDLAIDCHAVLELCYRGYYFATETGGCARSDVGLDHDRSRRPAAELLRDNGCITEGHRISHTLPDGVRTTHWLDITSTGLILMRRLSRDLRPLNARRKR